MEKVKRVKTAFSSNSQLCHVFAQQKQTEGHTKNLFFQDTTEIYSYGTHFLAAKVHTIKGNKIVLINSKTYSNSTAKHLSDIRRAFNGLELITQYTVPKPRELNSPENLNHFDEKIIDYIDSILKTVKITNNYSIEYPLNRLNELVSEANDFFSLVGHKKIVIPSELLKVLEEHLNFRLKRTLELNAGLEERQKKEAIKRAAKMEALKVQLPELKKLWAMEGKTETLKIIQDIQGNEIDLIRVAGGRVITSRNAAVNLEEALETIKKLISGDLEPGHEVGNFSVTHINENGTIKIGCHCFDIKEVIETLKPFITA